MHNDALSDAAVHLSVRLSVYRCVSDPINTSVATKSGQNVLDAEKLTRQYLDIFVKMSAIS